VAALLVVAALAVTAQASRAQLLPVRLKLGIVQLSDGDSKSIAGTPLYTGEADVLLPSFSGSSTTLTAGIQDRQTNGNSLRVIPLTISQTSSLPNPAQMVTGKVYFGLGVGAYLLHAEKDGDSKDKTTFGGFGVVGYQLPLVGIFAELKYQLVAGTADGARPDGLLLMIGKQL